jgi:hypothetical protein
MPAARIPAAPSSRPRPRPAGHQMVDTAMVTIDALTDEITPLRAQLQAIGRGQCGARELTGHDGIGALCAATIRAELGDRRQFTNSDQGCGSAASTSPSTPQTTSAPPGGCAARIHRSCAGRCSKRPRHPATATLRTTTTTSESVYPVSSKRLTLAVATNWHAAATTPCVPSATSHGSSPPSTPSTTSPRPPDVMVRASARPDQLMMAARPRQPPVATARGGRPGKNEQPHDAAGSTPSIITSPGHPSATCTGSSTQMRQDDPRAPHPPSTGLREVGAMT